MSRPKSSRAEPDSTQGRLGIRIRGTVQGVGFRPFIHRLATELALAGQVINDGDGVWCEVEGPRERLHEFTHRLPLEAPPLAVISSLEVGESVMTRRKGFHIMVSSDEDASPVGAAALVPPDVAPCGACMDELGDTANRRYRYPFTCCTNCGPRYTVVDGLPYDRATTSMAPFALCEQCRSEYDRPVDRRFHAQATSCATCGPRLKFTSAEAGAVSHVGPAALDRAVELIADGGILAAKGLGGYQLLCRADDSAAVQRMRDRKHRDEKPFAVLVASVDMARSAAVLDGLSERALRSADAPIVLVRAVSPSSIAPEVAPGTGLLGIMLPSSPLHALLVGDVGTPLVCTSGNRSGAPIIIDDETAATALAGIADGWLSHDRRIARRADDSVGQVVDGQFQLLRRARGFAPRPVLLDGDGPAVLGVGAELKSTVCLASGRHANVSVHLGDLENPATLQAFEAAIADVISINRAQPTLVVHDLHPEYLSTKFAVTQELAPALAVQHHHAHLASCLVDNAHDGAAIGVIFDGLGWGFDQTAWGGEFLIGDAHGVERAAHLSTVAMPGGAAAIRAPWRMAISHLVAAYGSELPDIDLVRRHENVADVAKLCGHAESVQTSSMGRLFDAVAALCGHGDVVTYEGQAAIALEQLAGRRELPYSWDHTDAFGSLSASSIVRCVVDDLTDGVAPSIVAGRFHASVASLIATVCAQLRERTDLQTVALSGGVFQNRLLVELVVPMLEADSFHVLRNTQVPPNDGGISLGQVAIGRAHLQRGILAQANRGDV